MKVNVLVLGVTHFDGEVEGRHITSGKVLYAAKFPSTEKNKKGLDISSLPISYDAFDNWTAPAWYELDCSVSTKGFDVNSFKLIKKCEMSDFVE